MNPNDVPLRAPAISTSMPSSRRLLVAFDSQPKFAVPLTSVNRVHYDSNARHGATAPVTDLVIEATLTPYSHWGINE